MGSIKFRFNYVVRHIGTEYVLVPIGENNFNGIVLLNQTSAILLELLRDNIIKDATALFQKKFSLSDASALATVDEFITELRKGRLINDDDIQ